MTVRRRPLPVTFCYNRTSWDREHDCPIPGGMADALVQPILPHLGSDYQISRHPIPETVNVYYAHRDQYQPRIANLRAREVGVFVSHGIADKAWRNDVGTAYEHVFVSGPAWSTKMVDHHCPLRRIVEVGYTKLDPIFNGQIETPERDGRIRVVWAPTHGGGGLKNAFAVERPSAANAFRTSWWDRDQIVALLPEDTFDVIEAPHPRHRPDRTSTLAEYVGADVVIADGGSTIYEAWALDLPVVFPRWVLGRQLTHRKGTFEYDIFSERIGRHANEPADLANLVEAAATVGITEPEQDFIEPILPRAYRGRSGQMHAEALDEIASEQIAQPYPPQLTMVTYRHRAGRVVTVPANGKAARSYERSAWWSTVAAR